MNENEPGAPPKSDVDLRQPKVLRILCVEDVPEDAELYLRVLQEAGYQVTADVVNTREEFAHKLESNSYDVVLSDYRMPGWSGAEALEILKQSAKDIPFLLVTGTIGEEAAVEFIKQGAADYILKDRPARLPDAVRRALEEKALRDERTRMEATLQQSEAKFKALFETANDGITIINGGIFSDCNIRAEALFQCGKDDIVGHSPVEFSPPRQPDGRLSSEKAAEKIQAALNGLPQVFEWVHLRHDGTPFDAEVSLNRGITHEAGYLQAFVRDITDRKIAEERIQHLAYYDALTGLPNRTLLQDRLTKALAVARQRKDKVALLFLDLDRFKDINDAFGHPLGDLLMQEVAKRLEICVREQDMVARLDVCRLDGDEFLIVLTGVKDISEAAVAAKRFMDTMTVEFAVQDHSLVITGSLGISIFPEHGANGQTLIKNADAAMYFAKGRGRNNFQFFTEDMNAQIVERLTLESNLRLAIERKEFFLVYQPQMNIGTGRITGLEALLRWQHPELGLVPPDKFIPTAEKSGLILSIGEWVLRTACAQAKKWQDEGLRAVSVAVNVSAVQFRQENFRKLIGKVLLETGLASQYLELELTESVLLSDEDMTLSVLQDLKAMGLKLAIDDFGTGYSSLSYLKRFPISKLKIDRSFIRDVAVNPDDAAITTAIIAMAKQLKLKVIAEAVEDEAQLLFLRENHCDEIQGYYFCKPLAVDAVADFLRGAGV